MSFFINAFYNIIHLIVSQAIIKNSLQGRPSASTLHLLASITISELSSLERSILVSNSILVRIWSADVTTPIYLILLLDYWNHNF